MPSCEILYHSIFTITTLVKLITPLTVTNGWKLKWTIPDLLSVIVRSTGQHWYYEGDCICNQKHKNFYEVITKVHFVKLDKVARLEFDNI